VEGRGLGGKEREDIQVGGMELREKGRHKGGNEKKGGVKVEGQWFGKEGARGRGGKGTIRFQHVRTPHSKILAMPLERLNNILSPGA
jgi:hypothetical protein